MLSKMVASLWNSTICFGLWAKKLCREERRSLIFWTKDSLCLKEIEMCAQKIVNHSKLDNQHNWENLYDHLMSTIIFNLMNYEKNII